MYPSTKSKNGPLNTGIRILFVYTLASIEYRNLWLLDTESLQTVLIIFYVAAGMPYIRMCMYAKFNKPLRGKIEKFIPDFFCLLLGQGSICFLNY